MLRNGLGLHTAFFTNWNHPQKVTGLLSCRQYQIAVSDCQIEHEPVVTKFLVLLRVERWQSGLTRTPGKREYPKGIGGSNPPLSATLISLGFFQK